MLDLLLAVGEESHVSWKLTKQNSNLHFKNMYLRDISHTLLHKAFNLNVKATDPHWLPLFMWFQRRNTFLKYL